jgi:tRNA-2-methylthio-N6-dimethylallyladenosine synthase
MNLSDSEIVSSILNDSGYSIVDNKEHADIILLNTCSVRENAERKIYEQLNHLKNNKKKNKDLLVGVIGCMAERLQSKLIEEKEIVDIVAGPDEYRRMPELIDSALNGSKGIAVNLSNFETYDDIEPLRKEGISAWLSIMRGCNNFCSYCVVPYTRGQERSRQFNSIINEILKLKEEGFKEIIMLGQNVNSYKDEETGSDFADLLSYAAKKAPKIRFRFMTSHPQDMSDKLITTMAEYKNICKHIHLPLQSGSNRILKLMNRKYTIEHYLNRVEKIRELMPESSITTDIIAGYPSETLEDHQLTLDAIKQIRFDGAFMFKYSPREGTKAFDLEDDIPEEEKLRRLNEIITVQKFKSHELNKIELGKRHLILIEGPSKRNPEQWQGRTDTNKVVIFPYNGLHQKGDYIKVRIQKYTSATLMGEEVKRLRLNFNENAPPSTKEEHMEVENYL